jgi:hypothetical protein
MIKTKDIKEKLKDIQEFLLEEYKQKMKRRKEIGELMNSS